MTWTGISGTRLYGWGPILADRIVTLIDYSNYLEQQNEWVASLVRIAQSSEPRQAKELAEIVAESLHRTLNLARLHGRIVYLPDGHKHNDLEKFKA